MAPQLRPVKAEDADAFQKFVMRLSPPSRRSRFHGAINSCSPALLKAMTQPDPALHRAWVALHDNGCGEAIVGEARFVATAGGCDAELAIAVADEHQGHGIADRLLGTLVDEATRAAVHVLFGDVLEGNLRMFGLLKRHGFEMQRSAGAGIVRWRRRLHPGGMPPCGRRFAS